MVLKFHVEGAKNLLNVFYQTLKSFVDIQRFLSHQSMTCCWTTQLSNCLACSFYPMSPKLHGQSVVFFVSVHLKILTFSKIACIPLPENLSMKFEAWSWIHLQVVFWKWVWEIKYMLSRHLLMLNSWFSNLRCWEINQMSRVLQNKLSEFIDSVLASFTICFRCSGCKLLFMRFSLIIQWEHMPTKSFRIGMELKLIDLVILFYFYSLTCYSRWHCYLIGTID